MSADYSGKDERLKFLFRNSGGGGGATDLDDLGDVNLTTPTDGQVLKYDAANAEWVNANESGGGGVIDDGTVGFYKNEGWQDPLNKTYSFNDLGITEQGVYLLSITSQHANSSTGVSYFGVLFYGARYVSSYTASYVYKIKGNNAEVYLDEANETLRFYGTWGETYAIEVFPLHAKIDVAKHAYSAAEQVVGTWVDGSPIYEKTISFTNTQSSFSDYVTVESLTGVDKVIKMEWSAFRSTNNAFYTGNGGAVTESATYNTYRIMFRYSKTLEAVQYFIGGYGTEITDMTVTIQYTKST